MLVTSPETRPRGTTLQKVKKNKLKQKKPKVKSNSVTLNSARVKKKLMDLSQPNGGFDIMNIHDSYVKSNENDAILPFNNPKKLKSVCIYMYIYI